jgi:zinc finger SWIM domain-containing protein 3
MYDETFQSFKWLFETFLRAHNGKQPKTIYTDQDYAMGKAVKEVFSEAWHGLCTFHIMQNAVKHLAETDDEESSASAEQEAEDSNNEPSILSDFSACMYEYEDEATFEHAFDIMRSKVSKQTWLDSIYKVREKWAECYMKDVFTLGMRSTQLSESLNSDLKRHFKSDFDIIRFLKHFERVVEYKRNNELKSEFESRKKLPRIKMRTPMLIQASKLYTPTIFEAFQSEYERSMVACTTALEGKNEYLVTIGSLDENFTFEKEYKVIGDPVQQTSTCSCGQFNRIGILCGHSLKVLDLMNIKTLPTQYVLKRWTREARSGTVQDNQGRSIIENPRLDDMIRYKDMTRKFINLAHRAASHPRCTLLVNNTLDKLSKQVGEELNGCTSSTDPIIVPTDVTPHIDLVSTAQLKKKDVETKTSKRKRTWLDKKRKVGKKGSKKKEEGSKVCTNKKHI